MSHSQFHSTSCLYLDMHGLIFETSVWLLAESTRLLSSIGGWKRLIKIFSTRLAHCAHAERVLQRHEKCFSELRCGRMLFTHFVRRSCRLRHSCEMRATVRRFAFVFQLSISAQSTEKGTSQWCEIKARPLPRLHYCAGWTAAFARFSSQRNAALGGAFPRAFFWGSMIRFA